MGLTDELTLSEKESIEELRSSMGSDLSTEMKNDTQQFLRFLRARDFNLSKSEEMLRKYIAWRKANNIDRLLKNYEETEVETKYMPISSVGIDKDGSPVNFVHFGNLDLKGYLKSMTKSYGVKSIVRHFEKDVLLMKEHSEKIDKIIDRWVYIIDFENYSFAKATHKSSLEFFMRILVTYEANYPERLKAAFIINASIYFTILFRIIKPLLSGETLRKITIYGKDGWKEDLLKIVDADVLPAFLGGNQTDKGDPLCRSFIKHGGTINEKFFKFKDVNSLVNNPDVNKLAVSRMSKIQITMHVAESNSYIEWEFETKDKDIGFGLFYKQTDDDVSKTKELIPKQRIDTHMSSETGMYQCDIPGIYIIVFDNSYSWLKPKEIYWRARVITPKGEKIPVY